MALSHPCLTPPFRKKAPCFNLLALLSTGSFLTCAELRPLPSFVTTTFFSTLQVFLQSSHGKPAQSDPSLLHTQEGASLEFALPLGNFGSNSQPKHKIALDVAGCLKYSSKAHRSTCHHKNTGYAGQPGC